MKITSNINLIIVLLLCLFCLNACSKKAEDRVDTYAEVTATAYCESSWFPHSQTPPPAEGDGSPFDTTSTTNIIFHQWSWQKFLWLTKPAPGGKALFEEQLTLVDNHLMPVAPVNGVSLVLEDVTQAGSAGILINNASFNDENESDSVYYSIYANDILINTADSVKTLILNDTSLVNNFYTFPVGALEVKASWIMASTIPDDQIDSYYTSKAYIQTTGDTATMAMLGMHVVGVVKNHPEFIWATFEHKDLAPYYDWESTTNEDVPVTSSDEELFFKAGDTATVKDIQWNSKVTPAAHNVFTVFQYGVPRVSENGFMETAQMEPINYDNIDSLNVCVAASLNDVWKNYFYNGSIWMNTDGLSAEQQADTLVALGYSLGNASPGSIARGSLAAFNITMETFVQCPGTVEIHNLQATDLTNCFSCHTGKATILLDGAKLNGGSPLYTSHIFRNYLSKSSGVSTEKIEAIRIQEFLDALKK